MRRAGGERKDKKIGHKKAPHFCGAVRFSEVNYFLPDALVIVPDPDLPERADAPPPVLVFALFVLVVDDPFAAWPLTGEPFVEVLFMVSKVLYLKVMEYNPRNRSDIGCLFAIFQSLWAALVRVFKWLREFLLSKHTRK
jgi:hypothetical protein